MQASSIFTRIHTCSKKYLTMTPFGHTCDLSSLAAKSSWHRMKNEAYVSYFVANCSLLILHPVSSRTCESISLVVERGCSRVTKMPTGLRALDARCFSARADGRRRKARDAPMTTSSGVPSAADLVLNVAFAELLNTRPGL